eukprot:1146514-Pelagomonas_calceolata.AAC.1
MGPQRQLMAGLMSLYERGRSPDAATFIRWGQGLRHQSENARYENCFRQHFRLLRHCYPPCAGAGSAGFV